jgi:hypothetical protein
MLEPAPFPSIPHPLSTLPIVAILQLDFLGLFLAFNALTLLEYLKGQVRVKEDGVELKMNK